MSEQRTAEAWAEQDRTREIEEMARRILAGLASLPEQVTTASAVALAFEWAEAFVDEARRRRATQVAKTDGEREP